MRGLALEISSENVARSSLRLSTKNAWAKWARNLYPNNGVKALQAYWGLTEGEAKGVVYAQASQTTIDKLLDHPRGGFGLGLEILAIRTATKLEQYIETQANEARRERNRWDAEEQRLAVLEASLRARGSSGAGGPR